MLNNSPVSVTSRVATISSIVACGLILVLFWDTLSAIGMICWEDEDYSHGLILPFISGYLLWKHRDIYLKPLTHSPKFSYLGLLCLCLGLALLFIGSVGQSLFIRWVAFFPTALGTLALTLGTRLACSVSPLLLLLFMAKPLPDSLVPRLFGPFQVYTAKISARTLEFLDVPVFLVGNVIEIPGMKLLVEEACSGMRSLIALLTVSLIVLCVVRISWLSRAFVVLSSVGVALLLNIVRVAVTGVLAYFVHPSTARGFFHTFSGMVVFLIGLVILYQLGLLLQRYSKEGPRVV